MGHGSGDVSDSGGDGGGRGNRGEGRCGGSKAQQPRRMGEGDHGGGGPENLVEVDLQLADLHRSSRQAYECPIELTGGGSVIGK